MTPPEREKRTTVGVVEDNPDNRLLLRSFLEDHFDIREYASGPEALAGFRDAVPDLMLIDISLPGMDGTELLSQVRADEALRAVPAIALTAHAMRGDRERFLAAGFDDYLSKPIVDFDALVALIESLVQRSQSAR